MAVRLAGTGGPIDWRLSRNTEGHRTYTITHLVDTGDSRLGPAAAIQCPGLPLPGSVWIIDDDVDLWAFCTQEAEVTPRVKAEPNVYHEVTQKFSTRPRDRCQEQQFEDPLLEPPKIRIGTVKYTEEASEDRFGNPIDNSAFELFRGALVEFDANRPVVTITRNYPIHGAEIWSPMINTLNDATLWGFPARCIKLSDVTAEQNWYGTCQSYWTITYEFDIFAKLDPNTGEVVSGFDRDLIDEGTKVLRGHWGRGGDEGYGWVLDAIDGVDPNPNNPGDFIRFKDRNGENTRVVLNGAGVPYDTEGLTSGTGDDEAGTIRVEKYPESNFLILGIPTSF